MILGPPKVPAPEEDEREVLLGFLRWKRQQVVATTEGLTEEQLRWTVGDEEGRGPVHALFGFDRPVDLRWVLLHVIDDTAHHAGHADSTREMLDGRRMNG